MKEIVSSILNPDVINYRQCFPRELPLREELDKLKPNPKWAEELGVKDPNLGQRKFHGFGHNARMTIYVSLLMPKLEEELGKKGVTISQEQIAALQLSVQTHDLGYVRDSELVFKSQSKRHQKKGAKSSWLMDIFIELKNKNVDLFQEVLPEKVINLASQINRVHDYSDEEALRVLQKEYDPKLQDLPLELDIFKDLDAGLERLRTEEWFKKRPAAEIIVRLFKRGLLNPKSKKSFLHLLHFPQFEATRQLLPFAIKLYHSSIENPKHKKDQWEATMDTAEELKAVRV